MPPKKLKKKQKGFQQPQISVDPVEKASSRPSGKGHTGGGAGSHRIDQPYAQAGRPPRLHQHTNGSPSSSFDVNASRIMQSFVSNEDDKEWYRELFKKQAKNFLKPRFTVKTGFEVGLNCGYDPLLEYDQRRYSYGIFARLPAAICRQIEKAYPLCVERLSKDNSPMHFTVIVIGDLNPDQSQQARLICNEVIAQTAPFSVQFVGTDHFHNENSSIFFIKLLSNELKQLHFNLKHALEASGIPVSHRYNDDRGYTGHITLRYLEPGFEEEYIPFKGSWHVDNLEMWNMDSPVLMKLKPKSLKFVMGYSMYESLSSKITVEESWFMKHLDEIDDPNRKPFRKKKLRKNEVNAAGNVAGYTGPLGSPSASKKKRKQNAEINARSFGGGKVIGKLL